MAKFKCHQQQTITRMKTPVINKVISHSVKKDFFLPMSSYCEKRMNMGCPMHSLHTEEPMDTIFTCPPFAYPSTGRPTQHARINQILQLSLRLQKEEDMSDCSGFVSYVVSLCLKAVNIDCRLDKGFRKTGSDSSPHMWLHISGVIIDNCYTKSLTRDIIAALEKKHPKCYESQGYSYSNSELASVEKDKVLIIKTKKIIDLFIKDPHKALALCLNREDLNNYFFGMIRFLWDEHKVNISGVDPGVRYFCWQCGRLPNLSDMFLNDIIPEQLGSEVSKSKTNSAGACAESESCAEADDGTWMFPVCGFCKIASYCSKTCQGMDWKDNHRFTCQTLRSVCLLPPDGLD